MMHARQQAIALKKQSLLLSRILFSYLNVDEVFPFIWRYLIVAYTLFYSNEILIVKELIDYERPDTPEDDHSDSHNEAKYYC
jgi:hypothetical protein